jgi:acetyltransferase-like isoleucine patch superfamily enzyme
MLLRIVAGAVAAISGREATGIESIVRGVAAPVVHGKNLRVGRRVDLVGPREHFRFGDDVTLLGNAYLNATRGHIRIGSETHLDQFCVLYGLGGLDIGAGCALAAGVTIYTQSNQHDAEPEKRVIDQPVLFAPVKIGDDVWIGARAVILPGVTIGSRCVVAAGAVVRSDVADGTIVAGVPARPVGTR